MIRLEFVGGLADGMSREVEYNLFGLFPFTTKIQVEVAPPSEGEGEEWKDEPPTLKTLTYKYYGYSDCGKKILYIPLGKSKYFT